MWSGWYSIYYNDISCDATICALVFLTKVYIWGLYAAIANHMALSPKNVIFVNMCLRDIGIVVWISCYLAISVSFRTLHSSDFFGLDCFALFCYVVSFFALVP